MKSYNNSNNEVNERWSQERFRGMAELWKLSEDDQSKLQQLQQRISDIDHWKNDPYEVIRFYKEYKGNLTKVEKMFRCTIRWREDNNMEAFLDNYGEPDPLFHQWPLSILNTTDKDGDPIYVERMALCDSSSFLKHFGPDAVTDYIVFIRELTHTRAFWKPYEDQAGRRVRNFTLIVDTQGLSAGFLRPHLLASMQRMAQISQDNYPGFAKVRKNTHRLLCRISGGVYCHSC